MKAGVDFRMPPCRLRYAEQGVELGIYRRERPALAQHAEESARRRFAQRLLGFLPHAFGDQRVDLAPGNHAAHQLQGLGRQPKTQAGEACGKTRHP